MKSRPGGHAHSNRHAVPNLLNLRGGHPRPRRARTKVLTALTLLTFAILPLRAAHTATQGQGVNGPAARPLPVEAPAEYEIGGGERHPYPVTLAAGEFLQVRVEQAGADVTLRLLNAGGDEVARMNGPSGRSGTETLSYAADAAGAYTLEVSVADEKAARGRYSIRRTAARPATAADRRRVEVERTFAEGMKAADTRGQAEVGVAKFTEALAGWQELSDAEMADVTRRLLTGQKGRVAFFEGKALGNKKTTEDSRKAVAKLIEAARLYHDSGYAEGEAAAWLGAAVNAESVPDVDAGTVAELYRRAAQLFVQLGDKQVSAQVLQGVVAYSYKAGDPAAALQAQLTALPIYRELQLRPDEANAENDIGALFGQLGDYENALKYLNSALDYAKGSNNKCSVAATYTNIGYVYAAMGLKARALDTFEREAWRLYQAKGDCVKRVEQFEKGGDCAAERAATLINIGKVYYDLGDNRSAQCFYSGAEGLVNDESYDAARLNNIGAAHYAAGSYEEALRTYVRALEIYKKLKDKGDVATTQTNVAAARAALGEYGPALSLLEETLPLRREAGDRAGEAITLNGIGEVHMQKGDSRAALDYFTRALPLFAATGERNLEAGALGNAMRASRALGNRGAALFYGKQAVNRYQELRGVSRELKGELQKNYLRTVKNAYQQLAELLIEEGLAGQAVQVLNFYQDQQFFDLSADARRAPQQVEFTQGENRYRDAYQSAAKRLAEVGPRLFTLERRAERIPPTDEEAAELRGLAAQYADASAALAGVLKELDSGAPRPPDAREAKAVPDEVSQVLGALGRLDSEAGQKTAVLYTLVGDERLYVLLLGPDGVRAFSRPVGAADVGSKAAAFLKALSCPDTDPRPAGAELYGAIFGATEAAGGGRSTLAEALAGRKPDVLLWSLDGALRDIPVSALYDAAGGQYLVEKYQSAVFTRAGAGRFLRKPNVWTTGIGLGTSEPYLGYQPLYHVPGELAAIFGRRGAGPALVSGRVLLNKMFKRETLDTLNGRYPLVHITSHFVFVPGDSYGSVLLLGDGDQYRLFEMQEKRDLFAGVELLMLTACETAVQQADRQRKEIDSLAEMAQRQGANSVIATLWPIDDRATPSLVVGFYRLHAAHPAWPKSELLRQAQLSLLKGRVAPGRVPKGVGEESCAADVKGAGRFIPEPGAPLSHPYYWAPFVLYGGAR
ncbi:MAG TPA: CHAT domain-containing protein [Pyrinomonadaceae bacterium]|nr:CHAT domain-containing protein [Pyrinomonadaceae bacterium]